MRGSRVWEGPTFLPNKALSGLFPAMHVNVCCVTKDEASFTPAELEKLQKALNLSSSDVDDVIGACEFVFQQVCHC